MDSLHPGTECSHRLRHSGIDKLNVVQPGQLFRWWINVTVNVWLEASSVLRDKLDQQLTYFLMSHFGAVQHKTDGTE